MKKIEATRVARAMGWIGVAGLVGASLCACSGGSGPGVGSADGGPGSSGTSGTSGAAGASGGNSGTSSNSSSSASVNPTGSAPGEACNAPSDCLIVYCDCTNHSLVNAQRCVDRACQSPKAACPAACMGFGTTWSGTASVEKPRTSSASSSSGSSSSSSSSSSGSSGSGSSGSSGSACASFADCPPYTCTCIDGQTATDQGCTDGVCVGAATGCEATCTNTGHGGAQ